MCSHLNYSVQISIQTIIVYLNSKGKLSAHLLFFKSTVYYYHSKVWGRQAHQDCID